MKQLTKADSGRLDDIVDALRVGYSLLEEAVTAYNDAMEAEWAKVAEALQSYNDTLLEANSFRGDVVNKIQEFIDSKSEAWQEGDKGQAYNSWRDEWENADLDDIELDKPDELELDSVENHEELLGYLPQSAFGSEE